MWFIFRAVTNQVYISSVKDEYRSHMAMILLIHEYMCRKALKNLSGASTTVGKE